MGLRVATPAAKQPIISADVARMLDTLPENEAQIAALIAPATEAAETYLGRAIITQTLVLTLDRFPCWEIRLPRPPLQEVTAIRYLDDSGVQQTLDDALYRVSTSSEPGSIEPAYGQSWPSARAVSGSVEIEYVAGYGDEPENVPAIIKHAIVMTVGEWLEFREGLVVGTIAEPIPHSVENILRGERLGGLFAAGGIRQ